MSESGRRISRLKLLAFAGFLVSVMIILVVGGMILRPRLLAAAGPLHVHVENRSLKKLRADIVVEQRPTTIEMDPGESALVRFRIHVPSRVRIDVFEKNQMTSSVATEALAKDSEGTIRFVIAAPGEIQLEQALSRP